VDRNNAAAQRPAVTTGQYIVRPKDTLFSIAFRYGWDYKALAARNNIPAPYTIQRRRRWSARPVQHLRRRVKPRSSVVRQTVRPPAQRRLYRPSRASQPLLLCHLPGQPRPAGDGHLMAF
jgi:lipoprotein NlpD